MDHAEICAIEIENKKFGQSMVKYRYAPYLESSVTLLLIDYDYFPGTYQKQVVFLFFHAAIIKYVIIVLLNIKIVMRYHYTRTVIRR